MIELIREGEEGRLIPQITQVQKVLCREASNVRLHENLKFLLRHGASDINHAMAMLHECESTGRLSVCAPPNESIALVEPNDLYANNFGTTNFDIFSIYLMNYCSLLALKKLFESGHTYHDIKNNIALVRSTVIRMRELYVPQSVKKWRNKVAAHYAAADPKKDDNVATIMQSINILPTYNSPYYTVGGTTFEIEGKSSKLQEWSVTSVYSELTKRVESFPKLKYLLSDFMRPDN